MGSHRGLDWTDARRNNAGGEVERWRTGGAWGPGRWRAPPVVWAPREGAPSSCEHELRVSEARGSPAARNRHGGRDLTSGGCRSDSGAAGARVERGGPGMLHASMQSLCGGLQGSGLGGSAWPRRRKALRNNGDADVVAAGCGGDGVVRWVRRGSARVVKRSRPRSRGAGRAGDRRRSRP